MQSCDLEECLCDEHEYIEIQAQCRPDDIHRPPRSVQPIHVQRQGRNGQCDQGDCANDLRWQQVVAVKKVAGETGHCSGREEQVRDADHPLRRQEAVDDDDTATDCNQTDADMKQQQRLRVHSYAPPLMYA